MKFAAASKSTLLFSSNPFLLQTRAQLQDSETVREKENANHEDAENRGGHERQKQAKSLISHVHEVRHNQRRLEKREQHQDRQHRDRRQLFVAEQNLNAGHN